MDEKLLNKIKEEVAAEYGIDSELPSKWNYFSLLYGRRKHYHIAMNKVAQIYGEKIAEKQRIACSLWVENNEVLNCPLVTDLK
jgi:hypothetical protein